MKRAAALTAALVLGLMAGLFWHTPRAWACSCAPGTHDAEERFHDDWGAIFVGTVVRVRDVDPGEGGYGRIVASFDVDRVNKGSAFERERVRTAADGGLCGVGFAEGDEWQVWASRGRGGALSTGLCAPNENLSSGGEAYEPASYPPLPLRAETPRTGVTSQGVGVILTAVALFVARLLPRRTTS